MNRICIKVENMYAERGVEGGMGVRVEEIY